MRGERLSGAEARRVAIAAQGLALPPAGGAVTRRHIERVYRQIGQLQIDSVNVLVRSHYLPLFSRLGPYDRSLLDDMAYRQRRLFEYWSHEQSLLPVAAYPAVQWRMARAQQGETWHGLARMARDHAGYIADVLAEVAARGPITASELSDPGERQGPWWGWNRGKRALEWLHRTGQVGAGRRPSFERTYDLPERVLPSEARAAPPLPEADARRALLLEAARALGVATASDLADYHRQRIGAVRPLLAELVAAGELARVTVEGWAQPGYAVAPLRVPRRVQAAALLSPFDSLVWCRPRVERLFGFHLRIEIYTPAPKRAFGYYVLPFLWGDRLVGRVDLKADRAASTLRAIATHAEATTADGEDAGPIGAALWEQLVSMASWLGLDQVEVADRGSLARAVRGAQGRGRPGRHIAAR